MTHPTPSAWSPAARCRVAVLASGRGTNLQAVLDAAAAPDYPARVVLVVGNRPNAYSLERARAAGVPAIVLTRRDHGGAAGQDEAIARCLAEHGVDLVITAGYDRILGPLVLGAYPRHVLNVHPSLLPAFPGTLHAQRLALEHGVKISGCTVHFVTPEVDAGPIVAQAAVPVRDDDTEESLSARILVEENRLLPLAVRAFAEGRLRFEGRRVLGAPSPPQ